MSFPARISLQQDFMMPNRTNNKNSYFSVTPVLTPSMIRSANQGLKPMYQQSTINMSHAERIHEGDFENNIEPVLHHPGLEHHRLSQNRGKNINFYNEEQNSKVNRQRMKTQNPRNGNSFKDLNQNNFETINQINGYPLSESTYEQGEDLASLQIMKKNKSHIMKPLSQKAHAHKNGLQDVVEQLQIHNKQIMKQTKQTVQDYQMYISQLLEQNLKMQEHLGEYQNYLEQMQNQKQKTFQKQKQRQQLLQKTIKQKMILEKQIQIFKDIESLSPATFVQKNEGIKNNEDMNMKQEMNRKQQHIQMLQKLIEQKQNVIKKMATFNSQMCLQLMEQKNKRNQILLSNKKESERQIIILQKKQKNRIKQLQNMIRELAKQKENLKQDNINLSQQLGNITAQNESMTYALNQQNSQIQQLQSQLQTVSQSQHTLNHVNLSSTTKKNYKKQENQEQILWDQNLDNGVILEKIDYLLKCLYGRLKDNGKKKQYKETIHSIMRTLTEINDEATDAELSRSASIKISPKNSNILSDFNEQNQKGSLKKVESNNVDNMLSKNENILDKVKKLKKRMKSQTSSLGDSGKGQNNSNDDYEDDADIGVFKGSFGVPKQKQTEEFELMKNGGRNKNKFAKEDNILEWQNIQ